MWPAGFRVATGLAVGPDDAESLRSLRSRGVSAQKVREQLGFATT